MTDCSGHEPSCRFARIVVRMVHGSRPLRLQTVAYPRGLKSAASRIDHSTTLHRNYVLNSMRSLEASVLVGSHAIAKAHGEIDRHSPSWSFGYLYGGPLSAAFSIWLARRAAMRGHDRPVLFGRDKYAIDECLTTLALETPPRPIPEADGGIAVAKAISQADDHADDAVAVRNGGMAMLAYHHVRMFVGADDPAIKQQFRQY